MKFDTLREESLSLDFVKDNLENIAYFSCSRDKHFDVNREIQRIEDFIKTNGLVTNNTRLGGHFRFWEDFAELILQKDFKTYKQSFVHFKDWFVHKENIIEIDLSGEEIKKISMKYSIKKDNILCDIIKRRYRFEFKPLKEFGYFGYGRVKSNQIIEKDEIKFYIVPFNEIAFFVPKGDAKRRLSRGILKDIEHCMGGINIGTPSIWFLEGLLTPDELDEYSRKCYESQERIEWEIQIGDNTYRTYKSVLAKNNITLTTEESQFLRECLITHPNTLDLLGFKKTNSSFPKPFYFIEVKTTTKMFGHPKLTFGQEKFIEKAKDKFGILILHIKVEPDKAVVKFLSPT